MKFNKEGFPPVLSKQSEMSILKRVHSILLRPFKTDQTGQDPCELQKHHSVSPIAKKHNSNLPQTPLIPLQSGVISTNYR